MIKDKDKSRIQSCVDHINTAVDVDPWAKELVAEMGKEVLKAQLSKEDATSDTTSDCISRQAAIDALMEILDRPNHAEFLYTDEICKVLNELPSVQPEDCDTCKHGYFGDEQCNSCRVRFTSHYERRTDGEIIPE